MGKHVRTDDGRLLLAEEWGNPAGTPVLLLHGTPGSRLGTALPDLPAHHPDLRFFAYDRPGYGGSDRHPGRRVADAARDAAAVADALGIERFAVVGRSGGAPHALACAALLPERVRAAAALVSIAPRDADGLDWFAGMTPFNVREYGLAAESPELLDADLAARAAAIRQDPERLVEDLRAELSDHDLPVVSDPAVRATLLLSAPRTTAGPTTASPSPAPGASTSPPSPPPSCSGTAWTTPSRHPPTPAGWPAGSPERASNSSRTRATSPPSTPCRPSWSGYGTRNTCKAWKVKQARKVRRAAADRRSSGRP